MKRRHFLKALTAGAAGVGLAPAAFAAQGQSSLSVPDEDIRLALLRTRHFNEHLEGDVYLTPAKFRILESTVKRFFRLQSTMGHGNFHLTDYDHCLRVARNYPRVGEFPQEEMDFMEMIFYESASTYGFMGQKPLNNITDSIPLQEVGKVPRTGNYLFRGEPTTTYERLRRDVGSRAVLTSGVRGIPKQFLLFLNKTYQASGNLSLASRSLAPPGYSFHGIGDFDVGQVGFGEANFTDRFVETDVFRRLREYGYNRWRYPRDNLLGVRFEPWHIKVVS